MRSSTTQIERITHNPAVMGGKPCIRGLRVTVGTILGLLANGKSRERLLQAYPYLEPEDIDAALAYAAWRLEEREEPLVLTSEPSRGEGPTMRIHFEIPKDLEQQLCTGEADLNGRAREAFLVDLYRDDQITHHQLA